MAAASPEPVRRDDQLSVEHLDAWWGLLQTVALSFFKLNLGGWHVADWGENIFGCVSPSSPAAYALPPI